MTILNKTRAVALAAAAAVTGRVRSSGAYLDALLVARGITLPPTRVHSNAHKLDALLLDAGVSLPVPASIWDKLAALAVPVYADPLVYPLDEAGDLPQAAYGVVQLTSAYSGPAIRVVRQSDLAEQDINFDGQGLSLSELTAFIGSETGKVKTLYDLTGNANHATQTTLANMGNVKTDMKMNGHLSISLSPGASYYPLPAAIALDRANFEFFSVSSVHSSKAQAGLIEIGAVSGACIRDFTTPTVFNLAPSAAFTPSPQARPVIFNHYSDASGVTFWQDDESVSRTAVTSVVASGGYLGRIIASGYEGSQHFAAALFFPRKLATLERTSTKSKLIGVLDCASTGGVLIWNGDSIIASSTSATLRNGIPYQTLPLLSNKPKVFSFAGGGEPLYQDLTGGTSAFNAILNSEGVVCSDYPSENKVIFLHKGTNDFGVFGRTSAQLISDIQAYATLAHAAGAKLIVTTLLPRSVETAQLGEFNTWLRANWETFAEGFVDYNAEPHVSAPGATLDPTLYYDGLHPTPLAMSYLAALSAPEINRVFALP